MRNFFFEQIESFRDQYHTKLRFVFFTILSIFLLSIFDSIMSYTIPNVLIDFGISDFWMGIIYSSSSFFGFILDFVLAKYLTTTHYKRTLLYTLVVATLFPIFMFWGSSILFFIMGMFIWGLYFNLWGFATSDFTARESKVAFHVASASIIILFHDIGYIIGMLGVEPLLHKLGYNNLPFVLVPLLLLAILLQLPNYIWGKGIKASDERDIHKIGIKEELSRLKAVAFILLPLLIFAMTRTTLEAITWTVTPVIDRVAPELESLGGVILAVNFIPSLIAITFAYRLTDRFGKKKTAIYSFIIGALILTLLGFSSGVMEYLFISFASSFFLSISYAATAGAYADYLKESKTYDNEIMSSSDMAMNLGYIIGPIIGGFLLSTINSTLLFTYAGLTAVLIALIVLKFMPKHIPFFDKNIVESNH